MSPEKTDLFNQVITRIAGCFAHAMNVMGNPAEEPLKFLGFLRRLGWNVPTDADLSRISLDFTASATQIKQQLESGTIDYVALLGTIRSTVDNVNNITSQIDLPSLGDQFAKEFPKQFLDYLLISYIELEFRTAYSLLVFFGIISESEQTEASGTRVPYTKLEFRWEALSIILSNPLQVFQTLYGWGTSGFQVDRLMETIQYLMKAAGMPAVRFRLGSVATRSPRIGDQYVRIPIINWDVSCGIDIYPYIDQSNASNSGLAFFPYVEGSSEKKINLTDYLTLQLESTISLDRASGFILYPPSNVTFWPRNDTSQGDGQLSAQLTVRSPSGKLIGRNTTGTCIQLSEINLGIRALKSGSTSEFCFELGLVQAAIVICSGEGDGFVQKILPTEPISINFDVILGFSTQSGFFARGGAGLEYTFQVDSSFGPISIKTVDLVLGMGAEGIKLVATATGSAQIGPVTASVQRLGLETKVIPGKRGLLGNADLALGFKPPDGIGLAIDAVGVRGGGFLLSENGNYSGILQLTVQDVVEVTAVGILTTKLPDGSTTFSDGSKIFSLKVLGFAEFPALQLGLGFTLSGIGLAVAIECCMNAEALRAAVYEGRLTSLLFPPDPIKNAQQIIADLNAFFPPKPGYCVFGAMVKIGWGGGTELIKAEVGIFMELGGPLRIAFAGIAHMELPDEQAAIIVIRLQVLGVIDFGNKLLAIDASLTGSRILDWPLDGDIALRSCWGDIPRFALSAGGFFPGYPTPDGFPALNRLSVTISSGNPRICLFSYLATTENSVQFGAAFILHWEKNLGSIDLWITEIDLGTISIDGGLTFDALFKFNPFYFEVAIRAWLELKWDGSSLLSIELSLTLSGPNNYHAIGKARFEILGVGFSIGFDETFGDKKPELPPAIVSPLERLVADLQNNLNWHVTLPTWGNQRVYFREPDKSAATADQQEEYADPCGGIEFRQKSFPLGLEMKKFGRGVVPPAESCLNLASVNSQDIPLKPIKDFFAPYEFTTPPSDDERFSDPPFQLMPSGVELSAIAVRTAGHEHWADAEMDYETMLPAESEPISTRPSVLKLLDHQGMIGSKIHNPLGVRSASAMSGRIKMNSQQFTVVGSEAKEGRFSRMMVDGVAVQNVSYARARQLQDASTEEGTVVISTSRAVCL